MTGLPAAVVFDWDSTLVDNWGSFTIVMNATYAHFGMPGRTQEEYRKVAARSAREVFPAIFGDRADEASSFPHVGAAVHLFQLFSRLCDDPFAFGLHLRYLGRLRATG